ncbi:hypothetical protein [Streptomyces sp. NPDC055400]
MTREIKRGDVWSLPDDRDVLVVSLPGLDEAYGAVLGLVLHPVGRHPDTAMSVLIDTSIPCTAVAVNSSNCAPPASPRHPTTRAESGTQAVPQWLSQLHR